MHTADGIVALTKGVWERTVAVVDDDGNNNISITADEEDNDNKRQCRTIVWKKLIEFVNLYILFINRGMAS